MMINNDGRSPMLYIIAITMAVFVVVVWLFVRQRLF